MNNRGHFLGKPVAIASVFLASIVLVACEPPDDLTLRESLNRLERSLLVEAHRRAHGVRRMIGPSNGSRLNAWWNSASE